MPSDRTPNAADVMATLIELRRALRPRIIVTHYTTAAPLRARIAELGPDVTARVQVLASGHVAAGVAYLIDPAALDELATRPEDWFTPDRAADLARRFGRLDLGAGS